MIEQATDSQREELDALAKKQFGGALRLVGVLYVKTEKRGAKYFHYTGIEPSFPVDRLGVDIGTIRDGVYHPTLEAAELIEDPKKNIVDVDVHELLALYRGGDISNTGHLTGPVFVTHEGRLSAIAFGRGDKIESRIPQSRRLPENHSYYWEKIGS